ncbi:MAG: PEP-CTERM sorting domain-containing protein [Phycisphaerae bacterium]
MQAVTSHSHPKTRWILVAIGLVGSQTGFAGSTFQGLGFLPANPVDSQAFGVSSDGAAVVGRSLLGGSQKPFRWTSGTGIVDLGDLPGGNNIGEANRVSANGSVVVGFSSPGPALNDREAFRWTSSGGMMGLGFLQPDRRDSRATGVSNDGAVVTGAALTSQGGRAFRWSASTGMASLGTLTGSFNSVGTDVSGDGSSIVGFSDSEAFRWTAGGGLIGLGFISGGSVSAATATSLDGSTVVGEAYDSANRQIAFRWSLGLGMQSLGLPTGTTSSIANDVSADGNVIAGRLVSSGTQHAFVWDGANGYRRVRDVLTGMGVDMTGWRLSEARGVSADGSVIVGWGINPNNDREAWRAVIPEPSTSAGVIIGILVLTRRRA